jgi:hypothetical protein
VAQAVLPAADIPPRILSPFLGVRRGDLLPAAAGVAGQRPVVACTG